MKPRLKAQQKHLRTLIEIQKHWDFWTAHNDGFFSGKISLQTNGSKLILTKKELTEHIIRTKRNIRRNLP